MAKLKPLKDEKALSAVPLDEPVLVELEPAPTGQEPDDTVPEQEAKPERSEDDAIESLQKQLDAAKAATAAAEERAIRERQERDKARQEAAERARETQEARSRVADTENDMVTSGLAAAQRERESARAAIKVAFEAADASGIADAQERLARAAADIRDYERAAAELALRKETAARQPDIPQQQQLTPEEAIDANPNLMPQERTWLKEHLDSVIDPARNQELGVAYQRAVKQGLTRGSEGYFKFINEFMGYTKPVTVSEQDDDGDVTVAAPVSRETKSNSGSPINGNKVHLTPEQREFARTMGLTDVQYATQVAAMQKDKKSNPEKYYGRG